MTETNRYQKTIDRQVADREETAKTEIDQSGNVFVTSSIRYGIAMVVGTPLAHGPCDFLSVDRACVLTVQLAEHSGGDVLPPYSLQPGILYRMAAVNVTNPSDAGVVITASWIRRPAGA